jgi:hypothetical protein
MYVVLVVCGLDEEAEREGDTAALDTAPQTSRAVSLSSMSSCPATSRPSLVSFIVLMLPMMLSGSALWFQ